MNIAQRLARFAVDTEIQDIPDQALDNAAMLIASTIASAAMGSGLESARIVRDLIRTRGGTAEARIWFGGGTSVPIASAARINALMSDAAASDDSDLRNITHPGTTLVASALATGELLGSDGNAVLAAIMLGYEVAGRINTGVVPGLIWEKGFHGCMIAIFGGAVAAGRLMGLDADKMACAIGLAATSVAGLLAAASTSMAREHHAGLAAMMGVEAAQLAHAGYTVETGVLEHPKGFFTAYGVDAQASGRVAKVTEGFGGEWKILTDMAIKLKPGGHPYHAIADAAAAAATAGDVAPSEIASILIQRPDAHQIAGPRHPTDLIGVAHSPYFFAAAGAADRRFSWDHASPAKIMDLTIRSLLDRIEIGAPPEADAALYRQGAMVTIATQDGRSFTHITYAPRGAAANGINWADVDDKFTSLAANAEFSDERVYRCLELLHNINTINNIARLVDLIT